VCCLLCAVLILRTVLCGRNNQPFYQRHTWSSGTPEATSKLGTDAVQITQSKVIQALLVVYNWYIQPSLTITGKYWTLLKIASPFLGWVNCLNLHRTLFLIAELVFLCICFSSDKKKI
jgi:hypothetical protein